jgi:hypothetical protein
MTYHKKSFKIPERVIFDPSNEKHLLDYALFIKYNNWKNGCNYLLEDPYMDIPTMVHDKVVNHFLSRFIEKV